MTARPTLTGQGFVLRPPVSSDADVVARLKPDAFIHRMFGGSLADLEPRSNDDARRWIQSLIAHPCAWAIDAGGFIGETRLDRIDMHDRRASFAIGIHDPAWLGKGFGTRATLLVLDHAFHTLGLHRISLRVLAYNTRAIRCYERCGFVVEGREREAGLVDGEWHDDVIMGILDRELIAANSSPSMR